MRESLRRTYTNTKGKRTRDDEHTSDDSGLFVFVIVVYGSTIVSISQTVTKDLRGSTHLVGFIVVGRDDVRVPGHADVRGRSPPGHQIVLEHLQWVYCMVQTDLASGRERLVKGIVKTRICCFVQRCQARLDPSGRIRHGKRVEERGSVDEI